MNEIPLKYGLNPHQAFARLCSHGPMPLSVLNGKPSYINILDALRGWQLVRELRASLDKPAAASFKHVSPAGAAVAGTLSDDFRRGHFYDPPRRGSHLSPIATAYARARSSDRQASFGDFVAVSERVDLSLAETLKPEVSDGIIAPAYAPDALKLLSQKKGGGYVILKMDAEYEPPPVEHRQEYGLRLEQSHSEAVIDASLLKKIATKNKKLPRSAVEALLVAMVTLRHTQSNSVIVSHNGQAVGIGAGQQSRIACTRLACDKAERFFLKTHPKALALPYKDDLGRPERVNIADNFVQWDTLDDAEQAAVLDGLKRKPNPITPEERRDWLDGIGGVSLGSDAFFPFRDNLDRAARTGVKYVANPGGSRRDDLVIEAADEHEMVMAMTGLRLFLH